MSMVSPELLRRFDVPGPRYTSYPTADRFVEAFSSTHFEQALAQRRADALPGARPLSLYVHLPFCEQLCYFCACNKIVTRDKGRAAHYLGHLERELDLVLASLGRGQSLSQLHLGGGTPTFFSDAELAQLMRLLRQAFDVQEQAECSIEVDPRTVDEARLGRLLALGFNRISFGVQDFDPDVQQAVHRIQPREMVFDLVCAARAVGFASINLDLIYGLPRQTEASFARTLDSVVQLRPERIALYGYAHLPERFKPQRRIVPAELPGAADKVLMLSRAIEAFGQAGYTYVGMDHFALPNDALAQAKREGRLHRDFQGYSTQPEGDLVGLGVSAISRIGAIYSQNAKGLEEYQDSLEQGRLPVARGLALSLDDLVRRSVIMALMCRGQVLFEPMELAWMIDFGERFQGELQALEEYEDLGLVRLDKEGIQVTETGWYMVRAIAMVFDHYAQADQQRARYSRLI